MLTFGMNTTPDPIPVRKRRDTPAAPAEPELPPRGPARRPATPEGAPPPKDAGPARAGGAGEGGYGGLFLAGLALILAYLDPLVVGLEPRPELSLALAAAGIGLGWWGGRQGSRRVQVAAAVWLWLGIAGGILTQLQPLGVAPGTVFVPRLGLLGVALLGWLFLIDLPGPWRRGLVAAALPTALLLGWIWISVPPLLRNAAFYRLAVDSHGRVYATDSDVGAIWVFTPQGNVEGKLWPRRTGTPLTPGPGLQPAGTRRELLPLRVGPTPTPGGPTEQEFPFCGLAVDSQDRLFVLDLLLRQVLRFSAGGQLERVWNLNTDYQPVANCITLDHSHVYVADGSGNHIVAYDFDGNRQSDWTVADRIWGIDSMPNGDLAVLYSAQTAKTLVQIRHSGDGNIVREWELPPPASALEVPYQTIFARHDGTILVSNVTNAGGANGELLHYTAEGVPLAPLTIPGQPGQPGGPAGIAEDSAGRLYVADFNLRVIHRFTADGRRDATWQAIQDEESGD